MPETSGAVVRALLDELAARIRSSLGAKLVGLYLFGSLASGDFDEESSDIDLLAVLTSDLSDAEFDVQDRMHADFTAEHGAWEDRLDIAYVSVAALKHFGTGTSQIAIITPGEPFHRTEMDPGWLMNWYVVQEQGVTLFGPPPGAIIRPIARAEFVQAVRRQATLWPGWVEGPHQRKQQAYVILTMCRALYTHRTGGHVSKRRAAAWAEGELPQWAPLIQSALRWRATWRDQDVDHAATLPETQRFVQDVARRIAAG